MNFALLRCSSLTFTISLLRSTPKREPRGALSKSYMSRICVESKVVEGGRGGWKWEEIGSKAN